MEWLVIIALAIVVLVLFSRLNALSQEFDRLLRRQDALYRLISERHLREDTAAAEHTPPPRTAAPPPAPMPPEPPTAPPPPIPAPLPPAPASATDATPRVSAFREARTEPPAEPPAAPPPPTSTPTPSPEPPVAPRTSSFRDYLQDATPPAPAAPAVEPPPPPTRSRAEWEALIGGNLLNRIAVISVVIALGFLVKYAYDHHWQSVITPPLRVLLLLAIGVGFLLAGRHFHRQGLRVFAQGFIGGGIAILYLSVYAAYNFYHLVATPLALLLMLVVTLVSFIQSLRYNAVAVALLGWAGGFITPVVLGSHEQGFGLFIYLLLLIAGVLALQARRDDWAILEPLTLVATATLFGVWFQSFTPARLPFAALYLTVVWGLFLALDLYRVRRGIITFLPLRTTVALVNALVFAVGMHLAFQRAEAGMALAGIIFAVGLAYLAAARLSANRREVEPIAEVRYLLTSVALVTVACWLLFRATPLLAIVGWAAEALLLVFAGVFANRRYLWVAGLVVYGLAFAVLLNLPDVFFYRAPAHFNPLANLRLLAFLALIVSLAVATLPLGRVRDNARGLLRLTLHYAWALLLFFLVTVETNDALRHAHATGALPGADTAYLRGITLPVLWTLFSLPLLWAGLRRRMPAQLCIGLGALLLGLGFIAVYGANYPLERFLPALNLRALMFLLVIAGLAISSAWMERAPDSPAWTRLMSVLLAIFAIALGFELLTVELLHTVTLFEQVLGVAPNQAGIILLPVLWSAYALPIAWHGYRTRSAALLYTGVIILFLAGAWTLAHGIGYAPVRARDYLPVLNLRGISFAFVIAGFLLQARLNAHFADAFPELARAQALFRGAAVLLGFAWMTLEITATFAMLSALGNIEVLRVLNGQAMALSLAGVWLLYGLVLSWVGWRARLDDLTAAGLLTAGLGAITGAVVGIDYSIIGMYRPLLNLRAGVLAVGMGVLGVQALLLPRREPLLWQYTVRAMLHAAVVFLGFELITVEISDTFAWLNSRDVFEVARMKMPMARAVAHVLAWTLYAGLLTWHGYRRQLPFFRVAGQITLGLAMLLGAYTGLYYDSLALYQPVLNMRAGMLALLIVAVLGHARHFELTGVWSTRMATAAWGVAALLGFELLTVETTTLFAWLGYREVPAVFGLAPLAAEQLLLPATWALYAIIVTGIGRRRAAPILSTTGQLLAGTAAGWVLLRALTLTPEAFTAYAPVVNLRTAALALAATALGAQAWLACRVSSPLLATAYRLGVALITCCWLSQEIWQGFSLLPDAQALRLDPHLARLMALAAGWALFALGLGIYGRRSGDAAFLPVGFVVLAVATLLAARLGFSYAPLSQFHLLVNLRVGMQAVVILALLLHLRWAWRERRYPWLPHAPVVLAVAAALLAFQAISAETWTAFARLLETATQRDEVTRLLNMRQMALSITWLVYAILLSVYGFWHRSVALRVLALAVYIISIVKIFAYDLRRQESLYYILSLFALAVILFITSYLYQRYREVILGTGEAAKRAAEEGTDHA